MAQGIKYPKDCKPPVMKVGDKIIKFIEGLETLVITPGFGCWLVIRLNHLSLGTDGPCYATTIGTNPTMQGAKAFLEGYMAANHDCGNFFQKQYAKENKKVVELEKELERAKNARQKLKETIIELEQ